MGSKTNLNWQKEEPANFKINKKRLSNLKNRRKKNEEKSMEHQRPVKYH